MADQTPGVIDLPYNCEKFLQLHPKMSGLFTYRTPFKPYDGEQCLLTIWLPSGAMPIISICWLTRQPNPATSPQQKALNRRARTGTNFDFAITVLNFKAAGDSPEMWS